MTLVIAHRGASAAHPENSIAAFEGALEMGADWVELDVRRTKDGSVVVHHDHNLADGRNIVDTDVSDLPEEVPTLEAVIEACGSMGINIEIKSDFDEPDYHEDYPVVKAVLDIVRSRVTKERLIISSFDMGAINAVHDHDKAMPTGFLTADDHGADVAVGRAVAHQHTALHPWVDVVTQRYVDTAHAAELPVYTWTCDDPDRMRELIGYGVDGIISNTPDVLRSVVDEG